MPELPENIRPFDDAQRRTIALTRTLVAGLRAGMSESDISAEARRLATSHGFSGWFHPPEVRIGAAMRGGPLTRTSSRRTLEEGGLVSIDLGPADGDAYGDFGVTAALGAESPVMALARECVRACVGYSSRWKTVGEIYVYAESYAKNQRIKLLNRDAIGHRVLMREGLAGVAWPRGAHLLSGVGRNRMIRLHPERMRGMFAVRPMLDDHGAIASFEEMMFVSEEGRWALGRDRFEDCGTL